MSNISGVPSYTPPPPPDYVSPVVQKIESQIGKISDLYHDISAIMRQISALEPPKIPTRGADESDDSWAAKMQKFNGDMATFQGKLNALNGQLRNAQSRLGRAQMVLQRLQNSEMPAAERKQAQEIEKNFKDAQRALEEGVKAAEDLSKSSAGTGAEESSRVELKVIEKKEEIDAVFEGASLKNLVSMFSLAAIMLQASPEKANNPFTKVPTAGGSGLPPVSTP
jgi:chromosome segregation ATPase